MLRYLLIFNRLGSFYSKNQSTLNMSLQCYVSKLITSCQSSVVYQVSQLSMLVTQQLMIWDTMYTYTSPAPNT